MYLVLHWLSLDISFFFCELKECRPLVVNPSECQLHFLYYQMQFITKFKLITILTNFWISDLPENHFGQWSLLHIDCCCCCCYYYYYYHRAANNSCRPKIILPCPAEHCVWPKFFLSGTNIFVVMNQKWSSTCVVRPYFCFIFD